MNLRFEVILAAFGAALLAPATAAAMCGCMMPVDDTGIPENTTLQSDATQVVMMRHGTTTIQTMQNRYEGPVENFAIVIPTPEVLQEEQVRTLEPEVFEQIDRVSAPTLTEYWQHDPCEEVAGFGSVGTAEDSSPNSNNSSTNNDFDPRESGVVVEAEFAVGEYDVQILSAEEGIGLEDWLGENGYRIPQGASKYLQPYIDGGMYFFVAKVDVERVSFADERAILSPLRFHYDQEAFTLPTRLGMLNSAGRQDLLVYTLGESRFEAANHPNATIPTNVSVTEQVKNDFGSFYDQLFEETLAAYGDPVVTEYAGGAWALPPQEIASLGADVMMEKDPTFSPHNLVLTRLHFRYAKDGLGEDVVFQRADGIVGGQEVWNERTVDPTLMEQGVMDSAGFNNFRAHYIIKHAWTGPVECENPANNRWGGNPDADNPHEPVRSTALSPNSTNAEIFASQGKHPMPVSALIDEDVPEIGLERQIPPKDSPSACTVTKSAAYGAVPGSLFLLVLGFLGLARRRA